MTNILTLDCETVYTADQVQGGWNNIPGMELAVLGMHNQQESAEEQMFFSPTETSLSNASPHLRLAHDATQQVINDADLIIGFNSDHFDFVLLESAGFDMSHAKEVHFDIMLEYAKGKAWGRKWDVSLRGWEPPYEFQERVLVKVSANRISLQSLALPLGVGNKSMSGKLAPQLWQGAELLYHRYTKGQGFEISTQDRLRAEANMTSACYLYQQVIHYCLQDVSITRAIFDKLVSSKGVIEIWDRKLKSNVQLDLAIPGCLATDDTLIEDDIPFEVDDDMATRSDDKEWFVWEGQGEPDDAPF